MGGRTLPTYVRTLRAPRGHPVDLPARRGPALAWRSTHRVVGHPRGLL